MRIAIDIRETIGHKAGKGWYTYVLVKALLKNDKKNEYILYTNQKNPDFKATKGAPKVRQKIITKTGLKWHLAVLKDLKKEKPDLFWAPTSYIIPALAPKSLKTIITVHDIVAFLFPEGHNKKALYLERITLKRALKKCRAVLTVSKNTRNDLIQWFSMSPDKIVIAPCAASSIFKPLKTIDIVLQEVRELYDLPRKFILAVGTLSPRKNFTRLITAYRRLLRKRTDVHLVIVGSRGWDFKKTLRRVDPDKVHLIGYIEGEELAAIYNQAELFIFPSLYEGFGIPLVEAMSCGCPIAASNVSSIPEVTSGSAILFDPYSVESIESSMEAILGSPSFRKEIIQKGKKRAKEFSWDKSAKKILALFKQV